MEPVPPTPTIDELLSHSRWVQRIARHLVSEDAEDAVQDLWEAAAHHPPPTATHPRGWLARVLVNRVRTRARGDRRRRQRELAAEAWHAAPATPEEATARLELQRRLATLVTELDEPYRHTVYLRYFQELEPTEIARMLEVPAGTVRWRLSEALARLRARLDEGYGNRAAWVPVLLPQQPPRTRRWLRPTVVVAGVGALAGLVWFALLAGPVHGPASGATAATSPTLRRGAPPRLALAPGGVGPDDCRGLEPLRQRLEGLKQRSHPWRNIREVFHESAPNLILETTTTPLYQRAFAQAPAGCEHSVSCRGTVCELTILIPTGVDQGSCHPKPGAEFVRDYLSSGMNNLIDSGTPFYDPLKGVSYTRMSLLHRFQREDGVPVPRDDRPPPPELGYDFGSAHPPRPNALSPLCDRAWRDLEKQLDRLEAWLQESESERTFAASSANPALAARVVVWAGKTLDRTAGTLPFEVSCRGRVCALTPREGDDPLAIRWQCRETPEPRLCFPARGSADWYQLIDEGARPFGRLRFPMRQASGTIVPAYLSVRDIDRDRRPHPMTAVLAFANFFDWRGVVAVCGGRFPARGTLSTLLRVPETAGDEDPPKRVNLHLGGPLGGTPLALCISRAFEAASGSFTIPPISNGATVYFDFVFPFEPASFEAKLARIRNNVEAARNRPAF